MAGIAALVLVGLAVVGTMVRRSIVAPAPVPIAEGPIAVQIATLPPGASVQVNGETKCTSDCNLQLPPGQYQIRSRRYLTLNPLGINTLNLRVAQMPSEHEIIAHLSEGEFRWY